MSTQENTTTTADKPAKSEAYTPHTPGPWEDIEVNGEAAIRANRNGKPCLVASCLWDEDNDAGIAELDANARLIAAAPTMLQALTDCITENGATAFMRPRYAPQRLRAINEIVRAAIEKASDQ